MADGIRYNSEEVFDAEKALQESIDILQNDIQGTLNNEFEALRDLDLFYDGMESLKTQINEINEKNDRFLKKLEEHDQEMNDFEEEQENFVHQFIKENEKNFHYTGDVVSSNLIKLNSVEEGKKVEAKTLNQILVELSYKDMIALLKKVLKNSKLNILVDENESKILVQELKKILNVDDLSLKDLDDKNIQKMLLDFIASNDDISKILDNPILESIPYLNKVAEENNVALPDLILKEENSNLLIDAFKDIYEGNSNGMLTEEQQLYINSYLESVAKENNVDINAFLSDKNNIPIIKGGLKNESNS